MVADQELEAAVYAAARKVVGDERLATAPLVRAIVDRSLRYTSERSHLADPADPRADLAARAAFFTIADAMKVAVPIGELAGRDALPAARPRRVVDVGAGCGAMSLGLVAALGGELTIAAFDHDAAALDIAAAAVRDYANRRGAHVEMATHVADVTTVSLPPADLVVMGTVLNELAAASRVALVERALHAIGDDGAVIVIEPALRETSRALHEVRDALLARGTAHVFAPCTRTGAPCPALADPSDWCHEDRALALPPRTAELARLTHLRDRGMKFSYLVLRRAPRALVEVEAGSGARAWRIVSAPHAQKGKLEVIGCSDVGRLPLRLLKRNRVAANRDLERVERGDVAIVAAPPVADAPPRVEIDRATTVERRRPAEPPTGARSRRSPG